MKLAFELGKTLDELKRMPVSEFYLWLAYFNLTPEDLVPLEDQARAIFGKPKKNG